MNEELKLDALAEDCVRYLHGQIWVHSGLTAAAARLVWLSVIERMVKSVWIDAKSAVIAEEHSLSQGW